MYRLMYLRLALEVRQVFLDFMFLPMQRGFSILHDLHVGRLDLSKSLLTNLFSSSQAKVCVLLDVYSSLLRVLHPGMRHRNHC